MTQTVILFWQENTDNFDWQIYDAEDNLLRDKTTLETLAQSINLETNDYELIIIIPSYHCFFTEIKIPPGSENKIQSALPYLIEEKTADEPEALFITRLSKIENEKWNIVAVQKEFLSNIVAQCRTHKLEPDAIIPNILLLEDKDNAITLSISSSDCLVRYHHTLGLQIERDNLEILLDSLSHDETIPKNVNLFCEESEKECLSEILIKKGFVVESIGHAQRVPTKEIAKESANKFNLMHNEFTPKRKHTKESKLFKVAGILFVAWLGITFLGKIAQYFYFKHRFEVTQTEIEKKYRVIFPDITRVVSPKSTLQRELDKLSDARSQGNFLYLITELGNVISKFPNTGIETADYKNSMLTINITVENFTVLKEIGQKLEQLGFVVKQENAVSQNTAVQARLILQKGSK